MREEVTEKGRVLYCGARIFLTGKAGRQAETEDYRSAPKGKKTLGVI